MELEYVQEQLFIDRTISRAHAESLTDHALIDAVLTAEKDVINNIVAENRFPAYDIALRIKRQNLTLSNKQRKALQNVYGYYHFKQS